MSKTNLFILSIIGFAVTPLGKPQGDTIPSDKISEAKAICEDRKAKAFEFENFQVDYAEDLMKIEPNEVKRQEWIAKIQAQVDQMENADCNDTEELINDHSVEIVDFLNQQRAIASNNNTALTKRSTGSCRTGMGLSTAMILGCGTAIICDIMTFWKVAPVFTLGCLEISAGTGAIILGTQCLPQPDITTSDEVCEVFGDDDGCQDISFSELSGESNGLTKRALKSKVCNVKGRSRTGVEAAIQRHDEGAPRPSNGQGHRNDGIVYQNRDGQLPQHVTYTEWGLMSERCHGDASTSNSRRVVISSSGVVYVTFNHYGDFYMVGNLSARRS